MAKVQPLPSNPSNADLALGIEQLHTCLEEHRATSKNANKTMSNQLRLTRKAVKDIQDQAHLTKHTVNTLNQKFNPTGRGKPVLLMGQLELGWKVFGVVAFAGGIWRFVEFVFPQILGLFEAIHRYIIR